MFWGKKKSEVTVLINYRAVPEEDAAYDQEVVKARELLLTWFPKNVQVQTIKDEYNALLGYSNKLEITLNVAGGQPWLLLTNVWIKEGFLTAASATKHNFIKAAIEGAMIGQKPSDVDFFAKTVRQAKTRVEGKAMEEANHDSKDAKKKRIAAEESARQEKAKKLAEIKERMAAAAANETEQKADDNAVPAPPAATRKSKAKAKAKADSRSPAHGTKSRSSAKVAARKKPLSKETEPGITNSKGDGAPFSERELEKPFVSTSTEAPSESSDRTQTSASDYVDALAPAMVKLETDLEFEAQPCPLDVTLDTEPTEECRSSPVEGHVKVPDVCTIDGGMAPERKEEELQALDPKLKPEAVPQTWQQAKGTEHVRGFPPLSFLTLTCCRAPITTHDGAGDDRPTFIADDDLRL